MNHTISTGIGVVVAILIIAWAKGRFGMLGMVVAVILVVVLGGAYVAPIKRAATGVIAVVQAPLSAARDAMDKKWLK